MQELSSEQSNGLALNGSQSKALLDNPKPRYLLNKSNGRVFMWQPILAVDKKYVDCDVDGNEIGSPQGDDPYIQQETERVAKTMSMAGANKDTIADYGRQLSERGAEKFKALENTNVDYVRLEHEDLKRFKSDSYAWVYERIDEMADNALAEIKVMTIKALRKQAGSDAEFIRSRGEVSAQWQIDKLMEDIHAGA